MEKEKAEEEEGWKAEERHCDSKLGCRRNDERVAVGRGSASLRVAALPGVERSGAFGSPWHRVANECRDSRRSTYVRRFVLPVCQSASLPVTETKLDPLSACLLKLPSLRFTVYGLRFTVHRLRFTVHSLQSTDPYRSIQVYIVCSLQFTVYSLQFTVWVIERGERHVRITHVRKYLETHTLPCCIDPRMMFERLCHVNSAYASDSHVEHV